MPTGTVTLRYPIFLSLVSWSALAIAIASAVEGTRVGWPILGCVVAYALSAVFLYSAAVVSLDVYELDSAGAAKVRGWAPWSLPWKDVEGLRIDRASGYLVLSSPNGRRSLSVLLRERPLVEPAPHGFRIASTQALVRLVRDCWREARPSGGAETA